MRTIEAKVEASRSNGAISAFNAEFRRRRLEAQRTGARFIPYGTAVYRLRNALGEQAASMHTGAITSDIISRVFGE